jgi:hypothetical protein
MGFESYGNEILYNGFTGQQIKTEIFIGPTFYFRLKHMVADKINVRGLDRDKNELPKVMLTRQPTSGRRKHGGLRIGEMERDSVLSHGTSLFLKETMMERSDFYKWAICKRCGVLSIYNPSKKNRMHKCTLCKKDDIVLIQTPYSFKLLTQELQCMGIEMRLNTERLDLPINDIFDNEIIQEEDEDIPVVQNIQTGGLDSEDGEEDIREDIGEDSEDENDTDSELNEDEYSKTENDTYSELNEDEDSEDENDTGSDLDNDEDGKTENDTDSELDQDYKSDDNSTANKNIDSLSDNDIIDDKTNSKGSTESTNNESITSGNKMNNNDEVRVVQMDI